MRDEGDFSEEKPPPPRIPLSLLVRENDRQEPLEGLFGVDDVGLAGAITSASPALRQYRTNELVRRRMNFSSDAMADFRRFTGGKSKNLQAADGGEGIAYAANELCGIALTACLTPSTMYSPTPSKTYTIASPMDSWVLISSPLTLDTPARRPSPPPFPLLPFLSYVTMDEMKEGMLW